MTAVDVKPLGTRIDSDFRCRVRLTDIADGIGEAWRAHFGISLEHGREVSTTATTGSAWNGLLPGSLWDPPEHVSPLSVEEACRRLDAVGIDRAVVNPGIAPRLTGLSNARWAAEIARATNRWIERTWLESDERFLGSIVVSARDPRLAAEEVRRSGRHPRVVQVVLAFPHVYLGDRSMHPLYEAALECGLSIFLQAGGAYTGSSRGFTAVGGPFHAYEGHAAWCQAAQPHLASLIAQGTFERYPGLQLGLGGFGAAWLPSLVWHLDTLFEKGIVPVPPSLTRRPSELLAERVFVTTERLEADPVTVLDLISGLDRAPSPMFGSGARGLEDRPAELGPDIPANWLDELLVRAPARLHPAAVRLRRGALT